MRWVFSSLKMPPCCASVTRRSALMCAPLSKTHTETVIG
jgi:hypothetical protein